jgi:dTDP-4-amino-4,6-dideoxygalactose transaminase
MAGIALTQLKYLDEDNARRREIVKMYNEGFKNNPHIKIVPANYADECSYHLYELIVPDREDLLNKLSDVGINCGVHYRDNTEYKIFAFGDGQAPKAREVSQHLITMPLHMWLTDDDVKEIIEAVNKFA